MKRRRGPRGAGGPAPADARRAILAPLSLLVLLAAAVGFDVARIGFFADDFHFLDIGRRVGLVPLLSGQYGMWPWFRPLSRELYFKLVVLAGPASLTLAHLLSLGCLFGCAWLLWRIGRSLVGASAAAVAVVLFLSYAFTKFLAAWASGFQDLLALLLMLLALDRLLRGRRMVAVAYAFLAPFAKEPGFAAFPLLVACDLLCVSRRLDRPWIGRLVASGGVAALVHLVARLSWHTAGGTGRASLAPERLTTILGEAAGGFLSLRPVTGEWTIALSALAGGSAALWLATAAPPRAPEAQVAPGSPAPGGVRFVPIAAGLGVLPVIVGHLTFATSAHAYHTFPAVPWLALLLGTAATRLPPPAWRVAIPLLVAWNAWGMGFRPPNLERPEEWAFRRWDWHQAVRFSSVVGRLGADVREQLQARPDSVVVLYERMPAGAFFQTEDGPATREVLGDATARSYWINEPPADVASDRLVIVTFDEERLHLTRARWSTSTAVSRGMAAIMARRGPAANAFARYQESADSARFDRTYVRAAALLLETGPAGFLRGLADLGLEDTLGAAPRSLAAPLLAADPTLAAALAGVLSRPLTAASHVALAESLLARGAHASAGFELRIAVTLAPDRAGDRLRLARIMWDLGGQTEALAELREIAGQPSGGPVAAEAHEWLARIARDSAEVRP